MPQLADGFLDQRLRERFLEQLDAPLAARIERFKAATAQGDAHLKNHWLEPDLVSTLNSLAQFLSSAIAERRQGRGGIGRLDEALQKWLYERLAPLCKQEGWLALEPILPYTTVFNPEIHNAVGSVPIPGATRPLIVEIKSIGRRHPQTNIVTRKADVIVGR
ncbi:MAG: hypothetical protein HC897_04630 [Thermoanaerobaculia bacterium]|nr:hypothetical protein [Thermoanaerobaculia bacterium]